MCSGILHQYIICWHVYSILIGVQCIPKLPAEVHLWISLNGKDLFIFIFQENNVHTTCTDKSKNKSNITGIQYNFQVLIFHVHQQEWIFLNSTWYYLNQFLINCAYFCFLLVPYDRIMMLLLKLIFCNTASDTLENTLLLLSWYRISSNERTA